MTTLRESIAENLRMLADAELFREAPDLGRAGRLYVGAETLMWSDDGEEDAKARRLRELRDFAKAVAEELTAAGDDATNIERAIQDIERQAEAEPIDGYVDYDTHREIERVLRREIERERATRRRLEGLIDRYRIGDEF